MNEKLSRFVPNMFYSDNDKAIGEFRTLEECMAFPFDGIWRINRTENNLFEKYKNDGYRFFIICCLDKDMRDKHKFVICTVSKDGKFKYLDMDDLPMYIDEIETFENHLGEKALNAIKQQIK